MQNSILYINEEKVGKLLCWDHTYTAVETALKMHYLGKTKQPPRSITTVPNGPNLYTMPGYLEDTKPGALACKLVTTADNNARKLPNIIANIALFDGVTGQILAIIAGTEITKWRTAAASVVATKQFANPKSNQILAILGSGAQADIHAQAFQHFFQFNEIRIWNRNLNKAQLLVTKLNESFDGNHFVLASSVQECLNNADVVITTTSATEPLVYLPFVKVGAHINAVGVASGHVHELDISVYNKGDLYVDTKEAALTEMEAILSQGITFKGEIGGIIDGALQKPENPRVTIFQSLGMAVEDCAMARLIYDRYMQTQRQ